MVWRLKRRLDRLTRRATWWTTVCLFACTPDPPLSALATGAATIEPGPACPPDMAFISGGAFLSGSTPDEVGVSPLGLALGYVPRPPRFLEVGDFCMDRYEFPNRPGVRPTRSVTFKEAVQACLEVGKRLCTEAEFERACGGLDGWHQPYGEFDDPGRCNDYAEERVGASSWLAPAGAFFGCVNPEGVYDLAGNLSEWVQREVGPPPVVLDTNDWVEPADESDGIVRGGTMWRAIYGSGCHARHFHPAGASAHIDDGFRCCSLPFSAPGLGGGTSHGAQGRRQDD